MARPCICDNLPPTGQPYAPPYCRVCWLWHNSPEYRALWEKEGARASHLGRCPHTGPDVEEDGKAKTRDCHSCNGRVRLKVITCLHPAREPEEVTNDDCKRCPYRPQDRSQAKALILKNWLSPGDVLVMSAALHSLHRTFPGKYVTAVECACPALWEHNPDVVSVEEAKRLGADYLPWQKNAKGEDELYPAINQCNQHARHFMEAYCLSLGKALGISIPLVTNRPHVYLSNREKSWINQVEEVFGYKGTFWLVNAGYKSDMTAKFWGQENYQDAVDRLQGRIQFVQVGRLEHQHRPLRGVLDLRGKTDDRQLIRLCYHSQGVLCGMTFLAHLAAALQKPAVVVAGGREPRQWNAYPLQHYLSTVGMLDCCKTDSCWRSRVVKLNDHAEQDNSLCDLPCFTDPPTPKCMHLVRPEAVAEILSRYP